MRHHFLGLFKALWGACWHYGVIIFGALALALYELTTALLAPLWLGRLGILQGALHLSDERMVWLLDVLLISAWSIAYVVYLRDVLYADITHGRDYGEDHAAYGLTWAAMAAYYHDADPHRIDPNKLPKGDWKCADGIILGHVGDRLVYRPSDGVGNLALFGRPGDGKTTAQIIPSAMRFGGSCLVIDIKGDVLHWTRDARKIKIFAPDGSSDGYHFDPLAGVMDLDPAERRTYIENLWYSLIPDEPGDNAAFFVDGARAMGAGIMQLCLGLRPQSSFMDIIYAILQDNIFSWVERSVKSHVSEAKIYLDSYMGSNEKNAAGQYKKLTDAVRPLTSGSLPELLSPSDHAVTPADLDAGYDVYIEIPQDKIKIYAPITTMIVQSFMTFFMRRTDSSSGEKLRPLLFLLDEFPQLGFDFDTLSAALSTLRSKKVSVFMAMQSIAQLSGRYGDDHTREIIDNCAYISIMSAQDTRSREFFSELIGTRKVLRVSNTDSLAAQKSFTRSVSQEREPIYQPEDFGDLKDHIVIVDNGHYVEAEKCYCFK